MGCLASGEPTNGAAGLVSIAAGGNDLLRDAVYQRVPAGRRIRFPVGGRSGVRDDLQRLPAATLTFHPEREFRIVHIGI